MKFLGAEIFQSIIAFFQTLRGTISLEYIMYIFVGLEILTIIFFIFVVNNVYEVRLMRAIDKLNAYLYNVQYIDDSNLIEFNNKMKRVPKTLRYYWQQYMLYREKAPSYYMSIENCIDRPTKASAFEANIKVAKALGVLYAIISFLFCCGWAAGLSAVNTDFFITIFAVPLIILLLSYLLNIALNLKRAANTRDLYQTFNIFNRFIDKAIVTLPSYVDFEVLFTRKEIQKGIPVLNEYIEKRQIQEQEEMKRAKENAVQHEMYNFDEADEKGELVLERAMKETEILISLKNRLNAEVEQIEKEIDSYKRAFENTTRDYQKKMQASKENIERLREQQEATTNRIESNYIRKQQSDEIKKQQQIEKEHEDATLRFNQEINTLATEIKKRKTELDEARESVEKSMLAEYKTYANKVFSEVKEDVNKKVKEERDNLISTREIIAKELEDALSKAEQLEKRNKLLVTKSAERDEVIKAEARQENEELKQKIAELEEIVLEKDQHISLISENPHLNTKEKKIEPISSSAVKSRKAGKKKEKDKNLVVIEGEFSFDEEIEQPTETDKALKQKEDKPNSKPLEDIITPTVMDDFSIFDIEEEKIWEDKKVESTKEEESELEKKNKIIEDILREIKEEAQIKKEGVDDDENDGAIKKSEGTEIEIKEESIEKEEVKEPPKRPRGRPRKIITEPVEPQPKRPRGRPRKIVTEPVEPQPKRPRGRPRKDATVEAKKTEVDDLKAIEEQIKKQNDILKTQQAELKDTIKKVTKSSGDKK